MKPVQLHFESPGAGSFRRNWSGGPAATRMHRCMLAAALGLAVVACGVLAQRLWFLQTELAQSTAALRAVSAGASAAGHAVARPGLPAGERRAWAQLAAALNTPWNSVFDTLERNIPPDVALLSIEPDAATAILRLEAEAATLDDLLKAARALGEADTVSRVALVKHETPAQQPGSPVRLVLELQWRPRP